MGSLAQADRGTLSSVLEGGAFMGRLRGEGVERPRVDPGLAGGLRDWLEDGLAEVVAGVPLRSGPVRVTKEALNQVLMCESHFVARRDAPRTMTAELVRGALVDAVFRQWVTVGRVVDVFGEAMAAMAVEGGRDDVIGFVEALSTGRRRALADEVAEHAAGIISRWTGLNPAWLVRSQERLLVPLAGGRVVLSGVIDLALGMPAAERASVCVVEVKSGRRRVEHRGDLHLYALMETLRSLSPPFRVATYYTRTGELDVEPVGREVLVGALHRVLTGTTRLCRLAAGAEPTRTPNPLCAWCIGLPECPPGQDRASTDIPRMPGHDVGDLDDDQGGESEEVER
ncbi:MAG: PD-(D/E)XK nuclease family protein [Acidimicrobiales bacterium]